MARDENLQERMLPPRPPRTFKSRKGMVLWVPVESKLRRQAGAPLDARGTWGLTRAELGKLAGVSQPAIAQLESPIQARANRRARTASRERWARGSTSIHQGRAAG